MEVSWLGAVGSWRVLLAHCHLAMGAGVTVGGCSMRAAVRIVAFGVWRFFHMDQGGKVDLFFL
jgi:hypothetical protein